MKKTSIIALLVIAVAVTVMISTFSDTSTYETFDVTVKNTGREYHVVGELMKDMDQYYNPEENPNYFTFYMSDTLNNVMKVILHDTKPMDIERSEKLVVIGKALNDNEFQAQKVLQKCPSKYKAEEINTAQNP